MGVADGPDASRVGRIGLFRRSRSGQGNPDDLPKPKKSAGRNLPVAIAVGAALGAVVLLSVWIGPVAWYPLVAVAMGFAMWEVLDQLRDKGYRLPLWRMIALGQAIVWISWPFGATGVVAVFALSAMVAMFSQLFRYGRQAPPQNYLRDTAAAVFILAWIPLFGSFAAMLSLFESNGVPGGLYIITFMLCVVASDTGGYTAGVMFGTHPMAPAISPKKTWEGFAGSLVAGVLAGALAFQFLIHEPWWLGLVFGALLVVASSLGDLVESQFKRELGIKDMSGLLPGHGGFMDRLDGMLPSAAVTWIFFTLVVL